MNLTQRELAVFYAAVFLYGCSKTASGSVYTAVDRAKELLKEIEKERL